MAGGRSKPAAHRTTHGVSRFDVWRRRRHGDRSAATPTGPGAAHRVILENRCCYLLRLELEFKYFAQFLLLCVGDSLFLLHIKSVCVHKML